MRDRTIDRRAIYALLHFSIMCNNIAIYNIPTCSTSMRVVYAKLQFFFSTLGNKTFLVSFRLPLLFPMKGKIRFVFEKTFFSVCCFDIIKLA